MTSSIYNYMNNAKVILPMTAACHDPVNVRTLDKSGNGLHFRFGDGATAGTFPTKLTTHGYNFNGTTNYLEALANQTSVITEATWVWYGSLDRNVDSQDLVSHFDATITRVLIIANAASIGFYCGDLTNFCIANSATYQPQGTNIFIAGTVKVGDTRKLYVDNHGPFTNATGTLVPGAPTTLPRIGVRYNASRYLDGRTVWYGHWERALTQIELMNLHARLRREINDV